MKLSMPTEKPAARILLVDDHNLFRQGLARLIDDQPDLNVVGQAADGLEAIQLVRDLFNPEAKILMLTIRDEDATLFEAIKAGANGYLLKNSDAEIFLDGIQRVLDGEAVLPPRLASRLLTEFARLANQPVAPEAQKEDFGLTGREFEVLNLIAKGKADKEIAQALDLSVYTIKSHVRSILSKLHAVNRWEAARMARQEGLLSD
jgi:two-component system NarL family response regulator